MIYEMVISALILALAVAYLLNRPKVDAWFARVRGTEGGKKIIEEARAEEERIHRALFHPEPSLAAAAPVTAAVPPAAEPPALPGTVAPEPAPSVVRETLSAEKSASTGATMNEGTGTIPAAPLLEPDNQKDLFFLLQVNRMFPGSDNLPYHVLSGSEEDIKDVISYAHATGQEPLLDPHVKDWLTGYTGPLKDAVKPFIQAGINKRTNGFSRRIYQGYFDKYLA